MCTNKKEVKFVNGRSMYVKCGHCPACLQEKAFARAERIRATVDEKMILFVTLTYKNSCVPYFDFSELAHSKVFYTSVSSSVVDYDLSLDDAIQLGHLSGRASYLSLSDSTDSGLKEFQQYQLCNVYRGSSVHRSSHSGDLVRSFKRVKLGCFPVPYPLSVTSNYKYLQGTHRSRVGVCFYPDFQNFLKRLRQNLLRNEEFKTLSFRGYYVCSEYGPTTCRPHFHALIFTRNTPEALSLWKSAISSSWPFDNGYRCRKFIEIAKNCASYVSSYVNCSASVPSLFVQYKTFRPCHHYSQGFGVSDPSFSLQAVSSSFEAGSLRYLRGHLKDKSYIVDSVLFPKYVISRYFPKFKGYSRLTPSEIQEIIFRPFNLEKFAYRLEYSKQDLKRTIVLLNHKRDYAARCGLNLYDFARIYSGIWSLYASNLMKDMYDSVELLTDYFQLYDNVAALYSFSCRNYTLEDLMLSFPNYHYISDPNLFPNNIRDTLKMSGLYGEYSKKKKLNNEIYSHIYHVF